MSAPWAAYEPSLENFIGMHYNNGHTRVTQYYPFGTIIHLQTHGQPMGDKPITYQHPRATDEQLTENPRVSHLRLISASWATYGQV